MTHPREDLTALIDGALPAARAAEVRAHLDSCPACREEEARLHQALSALAALPPPPELPPFFATRLEARLREERARPRTPLALRWILEIPRPRLMAIGGGVAAVAIAVAVPARSYLETRAMVRDLDLLQDYEIASALDVDTPEDAQLVAHLDQLLPSGGRP